jgi:hypothetical protein
MKPEFPRLIAARLGGVSTTTLTTWDVSEFLSPATPSCGSGPGGGGRYTFRQLVAIRVVGALTQIHTREPFRALVRYLSARPGLSPTTPLEPTTLVTDGRKVWELAPGTTLSSLWDRASSPPLLFLVPLDEIVAKLQLKALAYLQTAPKPRRQRMQPSHLPKARALRAKGLTYKQVADTLDLPMVTVYRALLRSEKHRAA